jgi:hypothetical protein
MIDALAWGCVWGLAPNKLFDVLGMKQRNDSWAWQLLVPRGGPPEHIIPPPRDAGLWHLLALLSLAQAGFLALAAWRPRSFGGLAVVPLIGHALGAALWLWALGVTYTFPEDRMPFPDRGPLWALALHDLVWVPLLLACLFSRERSRRRGSFPG